MLLFIILFFLKDPLAYNIRWILLMKTLGYYLKNLSEYTNLSNMKQLVEILLLTMQYMVFVN